MLKIVSVCCIAIGEGRKPRVEGVSDLNEVCAIPIIIYSSSVESGTGTFPTQSGYESESANDWSSMRWRGWERYIKYAYETLNDE